MEHDSAMSRHFAHQVLIAAAGSSVPEGTDCHGQPLRNAFCNENVRAPAGGMGCPLAFANRYVGLVSPLLSAGYSDLQSWAMRPQYKVVHGQQHSFVIHFAPARCMKFSSYAVGAGASYLLILLGRALPNLCSFQSNHFSVLLLGRP